MRPGRGCSESPLVDGPRVMVTPGGERGAVVALESKTSQPVWQSKGFIDEAQDSSLMFLEKGCLTIGGGKMICVTKDSDPIVLGEASPAGWKEHSRFALAPQSERRALKAKVWTPPVIARVRPCLRDQENLWCFGISLDAAPSKTANSRQPRFGP